MAALRFLAKQYAKLGVGIVGPGWYNYMDVGAQINDAGSNGAFNKLNNRVVGVVNPRGSHHWLAYHISVGSSGKIICHLFDPMQNWDRYKTLQHQIKTVIAPTYQARFEIADVEFIRWHHCKQQDGHPCGVWSLFSLESMLSSHEWCDECYTMEQFYRLRLLHHCSRPLDFDDTC
ncbi:hypothetical protein AM587_10014995 [Phytophthora nicotianae]|uniref:Ubiquitin-like protease family profile domain-containing protein n=1 Tax=Phytophthora nicotianae TaxID=4792 RepID=A0A0W8DZC6_PHYNI|nr:hypothetical protein AM587_10014995 [Phytophthora nicotianae]